MPYPFGHRPVNKTTTKSNLTMKITNNFNCTQEYFDSANTRVMISLTCCVCQQPFNRLKKKILSNYKEGRQHIYCSNKCQGSHRSEKGFEFVTCTECFTPFTKIKSQIRSSNNFCNRSCANSYNNKNKTHGIRRSKYEVQLEKILKETYPTLLIKFSDKTIIGSELDVYIPSLKLAFEIQGIFHYEPIFGQEKLDQIQKNDLLKVSVCQQLGIKLYHIDISKLKRCTEKNCAKYNQAVLDILKDALSN